MYIAKCDVWKKDKYCSEPKSLLSLPVFSGRDSDKTAIYKLEEGKDCIKSLSLLCFRLQVCHNNPKKLSKML